QSRPRRIDGSGQRVDQGGNRPRSASLARIDPSLFETRTTGHAGRLRHLRRLPAQTAPRQEPAYRAADARRRREDSALQTLEGAQARGQVSPAHAEVTPRRRFSFASNDVPYRMGKVRPILLLSAALLLAPTIAVGADGLNGRAPSLSAESVLLIGSQGKVLFAKNPTEDHAPASLVKLMTLYLACDAL